jgi:ribose 5-phosphate isomerase
MATFNEPVRDYEFLVSEIVPGTLSREVIEVTVATNAATKVLAGMVLGLGTGTTYGPYDGSTNAGYQTASAILASTIDEAAGVTGGKVVATAIFRLAEVRKGHLQWGSTALASTAAQATAIASLATKHIVARTS